MKLSRFTWLAVIAGMGLLSGMAHADAMYQGFQVGGTVGCPNNSCYGGVYKLQFFGDVTGTTFDVVLTAITPTSGVASGDFISNVEFGDSSKISTLTLTDAPGTANAWTTAFGPLSNNGCGGGNNNFGCSSQKLVGNELTLANADGSSYSWTWHVVFSSAGLDTNLNDIHIGLQYEQADGSNGLIVSEHAVPEPSSLAFLCTGLGGAGLWRRRRSWKLNL